MPTKKETRNYDKRIEFLDDGKPLIQMKHGTIQHFNESFI